MGKGVFCLSWYLRSYVFCGENISTDIVESTPPVETSLKEGTRAGCPSNWPLPQGNEHSACLWRWVSDQYFQIPVHETAPILSPRNAKSNKLWPLVIFSHGMAGSKTTYRQVKTSSKSSLIYIHVSQICGKLASEGRIVVAMEHQDGSGPAFALFSTDGDNPTSFLCPRRYPRVKPPLLQTSRFNQVPRWEQGRPEGLYPLRNDQLMLRHDEIYEAFAVMKRISLGDIKNLPPQRLSIGPSIQKSFTWLGIRWVVLRV